MWDTADRWWHGTEYIEPVVEGLAAGLTNVLILYRRVLAMIFVMESLDEIVKYPFFFERVASVFEDE